MTIVHFTEPLTSVQTGPKAWIKKIIGRTIGGVDDNIKRNGKEPVFDIVRIQSTFPDGTRATLIRDGKTYHYLVPDYTYEGGHLNEKGGKTVVEQLLILLANLSK